VIKEVDRQLKEIPGTTWQDSIYRYPYILGRAIWKTRNADAGIAAATRITDQVRRDDRNVLHQLDALDDLARLVYGMGRMKEAAAIDSASMVLADARPEVPLIRRGKARQRLGLDHSNMGDHERGVEYYLAAKKVYEGSDSLLAINLAEACNGAGSSFWHLGRNQEADAHYRMALGFLAKSTDPRRNFRMAGTLGNAGILWQDAGDFARSKANYLESIRICTATADTAQDPALRDEAILGRTRGYVNLATVYFALGDDGHSRELLELALKDRQKILEPDDPKLLGVLDRLADVEIEAGNFAGAEEHVRRYLEACEQYFGATSEEYKRTCAKLAQVHAGLKRYDRADSLFDRSITLHRQADNAAIDPDLATALRRRAQFRIERERYAEAIADLQEARGIIERTHDSAYYKLAMYDVLLAQIALGSKDPSAARQYANNALAVTSDRIRKLKASPVPQSFSQPHLLPDALYYRVLAERMSAPDAKDHARWLEDLDLGILSLSRNKLSFDDEGSRLGLIGKQKNLFHLAIDIAYEDWSEHGTVDGLDRILNLSEADRSILLKSRLNTFRGLRFAGVPDSIIVREEQLADALVIDPDDPSTAEDLDKKEKELADFLAGLSKDHPEYFALRYGEPRISIKALREKLVTPERDLLIYAYSNEHLYMLVVRTDTAALVRTERGRIAETVQAFNASIQENRGESFARLSGVLHRLVFAPVAGLLTKKELLIVPDGDLQTLNFEVLMYEGAGRGRISDHMLIQQYAIAYLLSATTAVQFADLREERSSKALALAPGFSDELKKDYVTRVGDPSRVDKQFLNYVRQPFALSTAEELGDVLSAKVVTGGEASEKSFRDLSTEYGILHLGTHAEMNESSPMHSRLVLSKDGVGLDTDADGYLHAYEIYELDLRAQLAVLTACETGIGKNEAGEGVRSIGYAFAYAGCQGLVTSLWSIDEKVSSEIISRFYGYLADGMPKHLALRQAKLDHLSDASVEEAMPYYWAGMVMLGDVEPIEGAGNTMRYLWWVIATSGAAGLIWWWRG
jgi:CHAT domain-containing protein